MTQLINLSKAARLVGVTRVALQKQIAEGKLPSFEGMVTEEGLLQVYPDVQFEDNTALVGTVYVKGMALDAREIEFLPKREVLAARLAAVAKELSETKTELERYRAVAEGLEAQIKAWNSGSEEVQGAAAALKAWLHQTLEATRYGAEFKNLTIRDTFLRVMASQVKLQPSGHEFFVDGADTVLEASLRAGLAMNYGCSSGRCGKCKARVLSGEVMKVRPHEYALSAEETAAGYALMCSNTAVSDVVIEAGEAKAPADIPRQRVSAHVKSIEAMGAGMLLLHLQTNPDERLRFFAGQNAVLTLGQALSAEFPIAGCPCDDRNLPFHIQDIPGNHFANYVATRLKVGDTVEIDGPNGDFALRKDASRPSLFIAFGKGFAPLKGMLEQAIALDATASMHLYWVVSHESDLYLPNWPRAMAETLDNFFYTPLVAGGNLETGTAGMEKRVGDLLEKIVADHAALGGFDVYAAGPEPLIGVGKRWLLAHGLPETKLSVGVVR